jgi:acyl-CoA dehydrogenase
MDFEYSPRCKELQGKLLAFMDQHIYPNEKAFKQEIDRNGQEKGNRWLPTTLMEELKPKARELGLWNLFLPQSAHAPEGLSNLDYAPLCEIMGRVVWASEVFNCAAPDTGNMETLERYGAPEHKEQWLKPLLRGEIRSAFAMTEPGVASSDATNIETAIARDGDEYVINGRKWWISGAGDPRCAIFIVMGKTDTEAPRHRQQSMILVPRDTPGITIKRPLPVFGYDDAPHGHCEILFENVRVPASSILLGEGRGFEIAQGRLGPGRIHHCMRAIGVAERALELMCKRLSSRVAFGKSIAEQGVWRERIAESRIQIDTARLLTLKAAYMMDKVGNKQAQAEIAMIKVLAPNVAQQVLDWSIQAHGAAGVSDDFPLAYQWAGNRTLRLADGPDEVHRNAIAKLELAKHMSLNEDLSLPITRS